MKVIVGGDVFLGGEAEDFAIKHPDKIWSEFTMEELRKSDLRIVNLESPLTQQKKKIEKTGPNLKASPKTIKTLKHANIDLVTLANNHILDYGEKGVEDTLEVCKKNGIDYVGADRNLELASKTYYKEISNKRLAIINFAENEWASAGNTSAGANPMNIIDNVRQIKEAQSNADYVLVIVHGGHEHYHYPSPRMVKQYRFYAENGASAIIGHHPHCVSGYENYKGVPIFYSIGNLFFKDHTSFAGWYEGFLVRLTFGSSISYEIIPYNQCSENGYSVEVLEENVRESFIKSKLLPINTVISDEKLLAENGAISSKTRHQIENYF
ncbi:MAG: CapA family protein [Allomuricauda sp.]